jgi:hypothetical protein
MEKKKKKRGRNERRNEGVKERQKKKQKTIKMKKKRNKMASLSQCKGTLIVQLLFYLNNVKIPFILISSHFKRNNYAEESFNCCINS